MGVRTRYTILYATLFLISAVVLLGLTNVFSVRVSAPVHSGDQVAQLQRQLADVRAEQSSRLLIGSVAALTIMLVVSWVLGRVAAGRVLRPLRTITAATRRISADNLHERLAVTGPADEVKDLADTVDALLERLEHAFAAQRRFVADASHELRTPLATMRASVDVATAKPGPLPPATIALATRIRTELDQVDRLLDGFLILARAQHGALDNRTTVPLGDLVTAAIKPTDLEVYADPGPLPPVRGNAVLLARMVANVVDNATVHNEPGGWIRVTAPDGTLVVENGGPRLDQDQVDNLGRPFHRLGTARTAAGPGLGLGLSIARAVAVAHGGTLTLTARPEGGLRVTITLPPAPTAAAPPPTASPPGARFRRGRGSR